jgi:putative MATE family efflux protein
MSEKITYNSILLVAIPIILESLAQNILNITDTAFMGRLGESNLGAAAIGSIFYYILVMMALGLGIGSQIIIARRVGEKNQKAVGRVFVHTQYILVSIAMFMILILSIFLKQILFIFINSVEIRVLAEDYLSYRIFGLLPSFLNISFRAFYVGIAKTKSISYSTIIMTLLNIVLNYILIFGKLGAPALGIKGAAIASVCAEFSALMFFSFYTIVRINNRDYRLFRYVKINFRITKRILNVSYPLMIQHFVSFSCWFAFFVLIEKMGSLELAVSNIIRSVYIFMLLPIWGFSAAVNTFVSNSVGSGNPDALWKILKKSVFLCVPICLALIVPMGLFPGIVLNVFTNDLLLINAAKPVYYVILGVSPFLATAILFFSALTGTGNTKVSMALEIIVLFFYIMFAWIFISKLQFQLASVWTVEFIYAFLLWGISFVYLKSNKWKKTTV